MKNSKIKLLSSILALVSSTTMATSYENGIPFSEDDDTDSYNYRDYGSNAVAKTFKASGSAIDGRTVGNLVYDTEIRTYDRTNPELISYSRDRKQGGISGVGINYSVITMDNSGDAIELIKFQRYSNDGVVLKETRTLTPGVVFRTEEMEPGKTFGSYSQLNSSNKGLSSVIQSVTLLGLEDVTVPAGSFTACLKILRHRQSERLGGEYDRINWFCPDNIGLAKSVTMQNNTTTVLELENIIY